MLRFADMHYPCLPVHDSFLVHHALQDELEQVMLEEFQRETGTPITTKHTDATLDYGDDYSRVITMDLIEALGLDGPRSRYERRLRDWRASQYGH